jgi:hypothetical protein
MKFFFRTEMRFWNPSGLLNVCRVNVTGLSPSERGTPHVY